MYHMAGFLGAGAPVFEIRDVAGPDTDMLIRSPALGRALAKALGPSTVVLMRGHGAAMVGASVRTAVMHAIYAQVNAQAQAEALRLGSVTYLNPAEAARTMAQNDGLVDRPWAIWKAKAMGGGAGS
jgi:HCOMODA/2-hydroxy-3-carboxy-muconic semialdehyde decarboxylase